MRALAVLVCLAFAAISMAIPPFWEVFKVTYQPSTKLKCAYCHTTPDGGPRNPYGKDVHTAMAGASDLTAAVLQGIEAKDSDGDSVPNGDEIRAGTNPGVADAAPKPTTPAAEEVPVPKHTYHPLVVHFPIGIYLFAAFLELWGWRRKDDEMRRVGLIGLWIGLLTLAAGVITGVIAMLRMGLSLEGTLLIHFILGISSLILGGVVVGVRARAMHHSPAYWTLLAVSAIAVAASGHYGALMVWG